MNHVAIAPSKGIRVQVTRMSQDCTNNGISATHEVLTVVGIKARGNEHKCMELAERYQIDSPTKDAPAVAMEVFKFGGHDHIYLSLVPLELDDFSWVPLRREGHHTPMAGGNTAASPDPSGASSWKAPEPKPSRSPSTTDSSPSRNTPR